MNDDSWYLEHLTEDNGPRHQLAFTIDLNPEDLEGNEPSVANWLAVLIKVACYVLANENELHDTEIEVEES
jgi:hypothetical protein